MHGCTLHIHALMLFRAETGILMYLNNLFYLSNVSIILVGGRLNNFKILVTWTHLHTWEDWKECASVFGK